MIATIPNLDLRDCVATALCNVFDTMLTLKLEPAAELPEGAHAERVSGCIGFGGETVTGSLYLHLSAAFARQATAAMLGMAIEELHSNDEVNDVVGELANMVAGGLRSSLCDAGASCAVSTPCIVHGTCYEIETPGDVRREHLIFTCQQERVVAELHIKFS